MEFNNLRVDLNNINFTVLIIYHVISNNHEYQGWLQRNCGEGWGLVIIFRKFSILKYFIFCNYVFNDTQCFRSIGLGGATHHRYYSFIVGRVFYVQADI